jgi:hypothetical protein
MDMFSYAVYALAGYNKSALQDPTILAQVSSRAFSSFFQSWISIPNENGSYFAWQPLNASLPYGLDFEPKETIIMTYTTTESSYAFSCVPTEVDMCITSSTFVYTQTETETSVGYPGKLVFYL